MSETKCHVPDMKVEYHRHWLKNGFGFCPSCGESLTMSIWNTEPPSVPGWYWAIPVYGGIEMVHVALSGSGELVESEYDICGPLSHTHWIGPLPVPGTPR